MTMETSVDCSDLSIVMTPVSCFEEFTAVILNGGNGLRIGGVNKAMIRVDGETIISRTLKILQPLFHTIILACNNVADADLYGLIAVSDRFTGAGPLAGIEAALSVTKTRYLFVFAGDMPWLSTEIISQQVGFMRQNPCDIVVPRVDENIEPLHSIIDTRVYSVLEKVLRRGNNLSVRAFFGNTDMRFFDVTHEELRRRAFCNINTIEDLSFSAVD